MRRNRLPLALCLALGLLGAGPALAQDQTQAKTPDQIQAKTQDQAKSKILLLETDRSAEEAKASLQDRSQDHANGGGHSPSSSHGSGPSASRGGGAGPHR